MGYAINPPIVRENLVFAVDAASSGSFDKRENIVDYSTYNAGTWTIPLGNATLTTGIDAPDGSNTAVRFTGGGAADALFRVTHPSVTPNGTAQYTISMYVRLISGTTAVNGIVMGWQDLTPSGSYLASLVTNQWVRITFTATPTAVARTFIDIVDNTTTNYVMDFWGLQIEKSPTVTDYTPTSGAQIFRGTNWTDMISGTNLTSAANTIYNADNGGSFVFSGASTSFLTNNTHAGLNLTNNMSMEAWVYITTWNDLGGIITYGTDTAEQYTLMTRVGGNFQAAYNWPGTWYTVTSAGQGTGINRWFHVVATFVDGQHRIYVNGVLSSLWLQSLTTYPVVAGAYLTIGNQHPGGDEMFYGRVSIARIYSKALTATQVSQNFAAMRGRYGI